MDEKSKTIIHVTRGIGLVNVYNGNGNSEAIKRSLSGNSAITSLPFEKDYMSEKELERTIIASILAELQQQEDQMFEVRIY